MATPVPVEGKFQICKGRNEGLTFDTLTWDGAGYQRCPKCNAMSHRITPFAASYCRLQRARAPPQAVRTSKSRSAAASGGRRALAPRFTVCSAYGRRRRRRRRWRQRRRRKSNARNATAASLSLARRIMIHEEEEDKQQQEEQRRRRRQ